MVDLVFVLPDLNCDFMDDRHGLTAKLLSPIYNQMNGKFYSN